MSNEQTMTTDTINVEGRNGRGLDASIDDDVEGHMPRTRVLDDGSIGGDTEGHGRRVLPADGGDRGGFEGHVNRRPLDRQPQR